MKRRSVTLTSGRTYSIDLRGFLDPPEQWDEEFAEGLAEKLGIEGGLSRAHWRFIRYLRMWFSEDRSVPVVAVACADNGLDIEELRALFPQGYHRGACRIAGINYSYLYESRIGREEEPDEAVTALGFLAEFDSWDEGFARRVLEEGSWPGPFTEKHREIIVFLRERYAITGVVPNVYETCRATGLDAENLKALFPSGYQRGACRAAGLPFVA